MHSVLSVLRGDETGRKFGPVACLSDADIETMARLEGIAA